MAKISHSAWTKYLTCAKSYDYHYNKKLRPVKTSSALHFGVAIDEALNHLLLTGNDPLPIFRAAFEFNNLVSVVEWDDRDLDPVLLGDQLERAMNNGRDYASWASMRVKGRLMLEAYQEQIYPLIEEVESVQENLEDRPGVLDAIVKLKGIGRILLDHKTSARPYRKNAVVVDSQLALYAASKGVSKAGFVVMVKDIQKNTEKICKSCGYDGSGRQFKTCNKTVNGLRCNGSWDVTVNPEANIQVLYDEIPQINKDLVEESISQVETAIKNKIFPRNLKACGQIYGKPCIYQKKCWTNNESGLYYKHKENK